MQSKLWRALTRNFLRGSVILLPILLSFYFLIWLLNAFDGLFRRLLAPLFADHQLPFGLSMAIGVVAIIFIGLMTKMAWVRFLEQWIERAIKRIPIVGTVFSSINNIIGYLKPLQGAGAKGSAVIVTLGNGDFKTVGFLTRDSLIDLPTQEDLRDQVAVYIPLAYMVGGGFTIFVKRSQVQVLNVPFEKAMQLTLTAWMSDSPQSNLKTGTPPSMPQA